MKHTEGCVVEFFCYSGETLGRVCYDSNLLCRLFCKETHGRVFLQKKLLSLAEKKVFCMLWRCGIILRKNTICRENVEKVSKKIIAKTI